MTEDPIQGDNPYFSKEKKVSDEEEEKKQIAEGDTMEDCEIESFLCPITQQVMKDPVMTPYGHLFERKAIEDCLE